MTWEVKSFLPCKPCTGSSYCPWFWWRLVPAPVWWCWWISALVLMCSAGMVVVVVALRLSAVLDRRQNRDRAATYHIMGTTDGEQVKTWGPEAASGQMVEVNFLFLLLMTKFCVPLCLISLISMSYVSWHDNILGFLFSKYNCDRKFVQLEAEWLFRDNASGIACEQVHVLY